MKDIVFIGGAKGVGKTTLLRKVNEISGIKCLNTGKILVDAKIYGVNFEEYLISQLLNDFQGILDTHYAGYSCNEFVRGLPRDCLLRLGSKKAIDFILIDIEPEILYTRRANDKENLRICELSHIRREIEYSRRYFLEYCAELSVEGLVIKNYDINQSVSNIMRRLEK